MTIMDREYIDEQHVVDRYVMGKLTDEELSAFELSLLDDPELQDEVQLMQAMSAELKLAETRLKLRSQSRLKAILATPAFGASAAVLCVLSFGLSAILFFGSQSVTVDGSGRLLGVNEFWLGQVRGGDGAVEIATNGSPTLLYIDVGPSPVDRYRITIYDASGEARNPVITDAGADKQVRVLLQGIEMGPYDLAVDAIVENRGAIRVAEYSLILR